MGCFLKRQKSVAIVKTFQEVFLCIPTSAADNAAVDTNGARRLLVMV